MRCEALKPAVAARSIPKPWMAALAKARGGEADKSRWLRDLLRETERCRLCEGVSECHLSTVIHYLQPERERKIASICRCFIDICIHEIQEARWIDGITSCFGQLGRKGVHDT